MPFQALLTAVLHSHTVLSEGVIFWLLHWYELFIPFLLALNFKKIIGIFQNRQRAGFWAIALLLFGAFNAAFLSRSAGLGAEGFRFALVYVVVFLLVDMSDLSDGRKDKIVGLYLILSLFIALLAIAERFLPLHYWEIIKMTKPDFPFGYGYHRVVAVIQSTSIIGAPNQLGTYLLPSFFLSIASGENFKKRSVLYILRSVIIALAVILTFSRSAVIGLIIGTLVYLVYTSGRKIYLLSVPVIVVGGWLVWQNAGNTGNRVIMDLFSHGASQQSHQVALADSLMEIGRRFNKPVLLVFGSGLGTAGPIALKYGGMVSETGVIGLALWLIFVCRIFREQVGAKKSRSGGLASGLIAVMVAAIFLHTFADNPAMSITLFALLGLGYNNKSPNI